MQQTHGADKRPKTVSMGVFVATAALVLIIGFVMGTRSHQLLALVGPVLGIKTSSDTLDLSNVQATYRSLKAHYDGRLNTEDLIAGASKGLVEAAGDQYTVYMDKKEADQFNKDLEGTIGGGIGAEIGVKNKMPTIVRVLDDNPAAHAGLKPGDIIVAVNDEQAVEWTSEDAVKRIRGQEGTTVRLTIVRDGETKEFSIVRAIVNNPSVQSRIQDGIGVMTVLRFDSETADLTRRAAESFKQQNVKGVILDVRDNGGGYLDGAVDVAGLWLDDKVAVSERTNGVVTDELRTERGAILAGVPTVVLTNGYSASASEIVAGALKDYSAATLVGEKTFGKGTVQRILNLSDGAALKVTVARWYTPKGKNITKEGIAPTVVVERTAADVDAGKDPQFDAAVQQLTK